MSATIKLESELGAPLRPDTTLTILALSRYIIKINTAKYFGFNLDGSISPMLRKYGIISILHRLSLYHLPTLSLLLRNIFNNWRYQNMLLFSVTNCCQQQ